MFYRPCPDIEPPDEADIDEPAMALAAAAVERGEQDLRMLERLADIGMELAEALGAHAKARLAEASVEGAALGPNEDPTGPFNKMAQTVRRTIALRTRLADDLKTGRCRLIEDRAARRAQFDADHARVKRCAVELTFIDAVSEDYPDLETEAAERLMADMDELLYDCDEFSDFLDRPVGETVARLCRTLGFDPALCVADGDGWKVRRPPYGFEARGRTLSPSGEGAGCDLPAEVRGARAQASTDPAGFP